MSIKKAVEIVFNRMPNTFHGLKFVQLVREQAGRPYVYDATVMRQLRKLREEGKLDYEVINNHTSKYKKKPIRGTIKTN